MGLFIEEELRTALRNAHSLAKNSRHKEVAPAHLLKALLESKTRTAWTLLHAIEVDPARILEGLELQLSSFDILPPTAPIPDQPIRSKSFKTAFENTIEESRRYPDDDQGRWWVRVAHLLIALCTAAGTSTLLQSQGATPERLRQAFKSSLIT